MPQFIMFSAQLIAVPPGLILYSLLRMSPPRGGISSRLTIDSDWEVLGGEEKYKEWGEDVW